LESGLICLIESFSKRFITSHPFPSGICYSYGYCVDVSCASPNVQERTILVGQPYVTSATAMLSTFQCAPKNSGLQVDFYVLMVTANGGRSSVQLSSSLHFPIDLVWCPESRKPDEWLQEAGGAVHQGRLVDFCIVSNRRTRTQNSCSAALGNA
jgi:hypothetical protein